MCQALWPGVHRKATLSEHIGLSIPGHLSPLPTTFLGPGGIAGWGAALYVLPLGTPGLSEHREVF